MQCILDESMNVNESYFSPVVSILRQRCVYLTRNLSLHMKNFQLSNDTLTLTANQNPSWFKELDDKTAVHLE